MFDAMTALRQLCPNGTRGLSMMIGAHSFVKSEEEGWVSFKFKAKGKTRANYFKISLNGLDLYDVEFLYIRGLNVKSVGGTDNLYAEDLKGYFERETGLYLSLR